MALPSIKPNFPFNKEVKSCVIRNEHNGGLTLGLINANFVPISVSCATDEHSYLLNRNMPSLPIISMNEQDLEEEADLFAYSLDQSNWQFEFAVLRELVTNLNFPNFLVAVNASSANVSNVDFKKVYQEIANIFSGRGFYTEYTRKKFSSYGGVTRRYNTFVIATQHPTIFPYMSRRRDDFTEPATVNFLETQKRRNGFPDNWRLDVLNDNASFRDQVKKLEKCVLPLLVKIVAETIIII